LNDKPANYAVQPPPGAPLARHGKHRPALRARRG